MDESASVALAGLDEAAKRGAAASDGALLAANAASSLQRLGRLVEADRVLTEALDRHPPRTHAAILRLTLAEVDVMRGRLAEAEQGLRAVVAAKLPKDYQFNAQLRTVEAELQLWTARVGPTIQLADVRRGGLGSQLADVGGDDDVLCAARLCWLGVRADADAASLARGEAATGRIRQLEEDGQLLADSVQVLAAHPLGDGTRRQLDASITLVAAELTRLLDQPSPDLWQRSAQAWEMDDAYLHGYSLWRLGLTLRAARRPREAERALRDGYDLAARTGMQALVAAIDAAGKALGVRMDQAQPPKDATGAPRPYNLTPKEMEVLEQLVAGRTNRRIATALFMSEKTASVHVSHILAKLAVTSRGEAIVRAYELGLTRPGRVHQG
jgi:DNA-binding CsgD family transcriptional regulator